MWLLLLILSLPTQALDEFSDIRKLEDELPQFNQYKHSHEDLEIRRDSRDLRPPRKIISKERIIGSGTQMGAVPAGSPVYHLDHDKSYQTTQLIYVKFFNFEDEYGFKYIQNKDGTVTWRIPGDFVEPIKHELSLYVPPLRYTPAPENIVRTEYDKKLTIRPEASFYTGIVQGSYMQDLFEDNEAGSGISTQYGVHFFTGWNLPIKAGAVIHYERSTYNLKDGGQIIYSAPSIGPQVKTRNFEFMDHPLRFQAQFRVSPFARATTPLTTFEFNSADLLASLERPIKNKLGEFVLGLYFQSQWLNIKNQEEFVNVEASNKINRSFGLSFSQVFE